MTKWTKLEQNIREALIQWQIDDKNGEGAVNAIPTLYLIDEILFKLTGVRCLEDD